MKNILRNFTLFALLLAAFSCSQQREWNQEQRIEFISSIEPYRQMIYLNNLSDPEFVIFTDNLATEVEVAYPVYTRFVMMPALSDTIDMWVVTSIVDELNADARNMRYLYPYENLVEQGVLPIGLDHADRKAFYTCFAHKIDAYFDSREDFFYAVITNGLDHNVIATMQQECAAQFLVVQDE